MSSKVGLKYHIEAKHSNTRNYACHVCGKTFKVGGEGRKGRGREGKGLGWKGSAGEGEERGAREGKKRGGQEHGNEYLK